MSQTNTLFIVIDPSGAQKGASASVNAINSIVQAASGLNATLNNVSANTGNMARNTAAHMSSAATSVDKLRGTVNLLVGAFAAVQITNMFSSFVDEIRKVDREYNGFIAMMNVTTGDVRKSAEAYQYVKGIAQSYGISIESLTKSYAKLKASTKDVLSTKETDRLFESFTATASVLHAEQYTVERMFNAIVQMASKGQVHMEELKQQLGEHLPGALALAAKAMKMDMGTMIDEMKKGNISARDLLVPLPGILMETFGQAAVISSKSLNSAFANLKTAWFDVMKDISTGGAGQGLAAVLLAMSAHLSVSSESFKAFGAVVGEAFYKLADFIKTISAADIQTFADNVISVTASLLQMAGAIGSGLVILTEYKDEILLVAGLLVTYQGVALIAAAANAVLAASFTTVFASLGRFGVLLGLVGAAVAGWQIGTYFKEKFLEVELAGLALASGLAVIPTKIAGYFEVMGLQISRYFAEMFQNVFNKANTFMATLKNSFSDGAKALGFDGFDHFKPIKLDILGNFNRDIKAAGDTTRKEVSRIQAIYSELADEAIDRKMNKGVKKDRGGYSTKQFDDAQARVDKFMADAAAEFGNNDKPKKGGNKGATPKFSGDGKAGSSEVMNEYKVLVENLKTLRDDEVISTTQFYDIQIAALTSYTEKAKQQVEALEKVAKDPKDKERLHSQLLKLESDYQIAVTKLMREQQAERTAFEKSVVQAEIDMGTVKLSAQEEFIKKWNENYSKLLTQANSNGQTDVADRLVNGYKRKIEELNQADKITMDKFFASDDEKYLIDLAESYKKMHDLVMNSTAFTETERQALIERLRDQHNQKIKDKENAIYTDIAKSAATTMQKGFSDFFFDPFNNGVKGMLQSFGTAIQRMIADAAAAKLTSILVGDMGKTGNVGGGSMLDLAIKGVGAFMSSFEGGGYTGNGPRSGGLDGKGGFLSIVHPKETIVDHTQGQRTPGNTYNVSIAVPPGTPAESRRAAAEGARTAMTAMNGASRYA